MVTIGGNTVSVLWADHTFVLLFTVLNLLWQSRIALVFSNFPASQIHSHIKWQTHVEDYFILQNHFSNDWSRQTSWTEEKQPANHNFNHNSDREHRSTSALIHAAIIITPCKSGLGQHRPSSLPNKPITNHTDLPQKLSLVWAITTTKTYYKTKSGMGYYHHNNLQQNQVWNGP